MRLYHRTTSAHADLILRDGFLDCEDRYTSDFCIQGVWFSDQPQKAGELEWGDAVISIDFDLSPKSLSAFEWIEGETTYREWLIPIKVVNARIKRMEIC